MADIGGLLRQVAAGDGSQRKTLYEGIHEELRALARSAMRRERQDHTLQPTALVNEAWLRLSSPAVNWECRAEFLRISARLMREVLFDHARRRNAEKRGGGRARVDLDDPAAPADWHPEMILAIEAALKKLAALDARSCQIVELRLFTGLTVEETASVLNLSEKTVVRDWNFARAWLERELRG